MSFRSSAGCIPCTWGIRHTSHSFSSYIKHLPEDSCRSQHADLLGLCHISSLWYSLDVFYHILLFRFMRQLLKLSSKCEDHIFTWYPSLLYQVHQQPQGSLQFSSATFSVFLTLGLCAFFYFIIIIIMAVKTYGCQNLYTRKMGV